MSQLRADPGAVFLLAAFKQRAAMLDCRYELVNKKIE